jgi:Flp pilus assembly protein TadG
VAEKERGAVVVEFAFVGPVLFLMVIGMLDFSLIILGNTVGTNAVREGARVGVVNYIDADDPSSANHQLVVDEVERRLVGLVRDDIEIEIRCVDGDEDDPHRLVNGVRDPSAGTIDCQPSSVTPGADFLEVSMKWSHIGASPFVANSLHDESAMYLIQGKATYNPTAGAGAVTTTTATAPASSTTSTTTTTLPGVTTTTVPGATTTTTTTSPSVCGISSYTTSRTVKSLTIYKTGAKAGQVKPSPGALTVDVSAPGCAAGTVTVRIPGGPAPFNAGVAMDFVSAGAFRYAIGGKNWSTGTYTVTLASPNNTQTFTLTVSS